MINYIFKLNENFGKRNFVYDYTNREVIYIYIFFKILLNLINAIFKTNFLKTLK